MAERASTSATLATLDDAKRAVPNLHALVREIAALVASSTTLKREEDYAATVTPKIDAATTAYQAIASFLQEHKKEFSHDKDFRSVQREFVAVMQELQQVQRDGAAKREQLCDADFLATTKISTLDIQRAKEEVVEAEQIASEAVVVRQLFQEVGSIVVEQGKGVDEIQRKVENIRIEISNGVNELEHARRLQKEAQQKYLLVILLAVLVIAAIVVPIVVSLT